MSEWNTQNVMYMDEMFYNCQNLISLDVSGFDTQKVTSMRDTFYCGNLRSLKTGANFKFSGTYYNLPGTWKNSAGDTFTSGNFPSNVADTYTRIS